MKHLGTWILTAVLFAALGGWGMWLLMQGGEHAEPDEEASSQPAATEPAPVSRDEAGNVIVHFDGESQRRLGIETQPLAAARHQPELCAFGLLQEDPAGSFTLRAPITGKVIAPQGSGWPVIGAVLPENAVVGRLEPRLGPIEQADLASRLAEAHANIDEVKAELAASRASLESKRQLNIGEKVVSDQVLAEAEAAVKSQEARLVAALATVKILSTSLTATTQPAGALPLKLPTGGKVVELSVQPGESVESGQPLLRVARFDRLFVRIALPAGAEIDENVSTARIAVSAHEDRWLPAERVSLAAAADGNTGGPTYLFAIKTDGLPLQPGLPVTAYLAMPGEPVNGVALPRSAVIRYSGQAWVYVQTDAEQFTRREVVAGVPRQNDWFVSAGLQSGEKVVTVGAQCLLSEELRSQTTGTEEEEE